MLNMSFSTSLRPQQSDKENDPTKLLVVTVIWMVKKSSAATESFSDDRHGLMRDLN